MNKISTGKNFIWYYIQQFVTLSMSIITAPYLARVLGSRNLGIFSFTFSNANFLYVIAQLGTLSYGVRQIALNRDDKYERSKTFWEIELLTVITSISAIIIFLIFISFQKEYQFFYYLWILFILAVTFDISWFYSGVEHFDETLIRTVIFKILGIIAIFIFVKNPDDLYKYIIIYSLMYLVPNLSMWTSIFKYVDFVQFNNLDVLKHFKETFVYFIPAITSSIYVILDKSMLGFLIEDKRENGYYDAANRIVKFGEAISSIVITRVFEPKTNHFYKAAQMDKIKQSINLSLNFTMFASIGFVFGIFAIADDFVPAFFGPDFLKASLLLKIMSIIIVITSITFVLEYEYLIPSGKRNKINRFVIMGAISNLILNYILIRKFASIGAVIGSIVAESIVMIGFFISADNIISPIKIFDAMKNKILAGFAMFIAISFIKFILLTVGFENLIIGLILQVILGSLVYICVLYLLKDQMINFKKNLDTI